MQVEFRFAWAVANEKDPRPPVNTSPFLKSWRAAHRIACKGHGERAHVWQGLYFGQAPARLFTDIECLGCGEHYREAQ